MSEFESLDTRGGFTAKLWRGERMCMLGFDVVEPEDDFVGFAIEFREPGGSAFLPLMNRIAFEYESSAALEVTGARRYSSLSSPFQKFRWVHFPHQPKDGTYAYRITKMHMPRDAAPVKGDAIDLDISLDQTTYDDFLDIGFTRNFASSQAFLDLIRPHGDPDVLGSKIIPSKADDGLKFKKLTNIPGLYEWLGFEAHDLLFAFLKEAANDPSITVDAMVYDFNEPDILALLKGLGNRLRIIIDDSVSTKDGKTSGHGTPRSAESSAATVLKSSAGRSSVLRTHCQNLQHNKVFIAKRGGKPFKVLCGSTNHSFRGLYIQANNVLVFTDSEIAGLFGQYFEALLDDAAGFNKSPLSKKWHFVQGPGKPPVHLCFSPHKDPELSLSVVGGSIDQATSSVFFNIAFLNQIRSGSVREAIDRLQDKPVFSYGVSDKASGLEVYKPDGSVGLVDFAYLAEHAPVPFRQEWSGGRGINIHHKFVVTDFNLPTARVFTGSCNHAPSGEKGNGDHLILIEDQKVATAFAIEAVRVFDHLHFRTAMRAGETKPQAITLKKPRKFSGKPAWFEPYFVQGSQKALDRALFSH